MGIVIFLLRRSYWFDEARLSLPQPHHKIQWIQSVYLELYAHIETWLKMVARCE